MSENLSAKYYQKNKENWGKKAHEKYQNLSKEQRENRQKYGREGFRGFCFQKIGELFLTKYNKFFQSRFLRAKARKCGRFF